MRAAGSQGVTEVEQEEEWSKRKKERKKTPLKKEREMREKVEQELNRLEKGRIRMKSVRSKTDKTRLKKGRRGEQSQRGKDGLTQPNQMVVFKIKSVCRLSCWKLESNICHPERSHSFA